MTRPVTIETSFAYEGKQFTLVFDWEVIADFEETTGLSMADVFTPVNGQKPLMSRMAKLLMFALRRHHPDITLAETGPMMADPEVAAMFTDNVAGAMPKAEDVGDEAGNAPAAVPVNRKARRAAKSRSAGKTG